MCPWTSWNGTATTVVQLTLYCCETRRSVSIGYYRVFVSNPDRREIHRVKLASEIRNSVIRTFRQVRRLYCAWDFVICNCFTKSLVYHLHDNFNRSEATLINFIDWKAKEGDDVTNVTTLKIYLRICYYVCMCHFLLINELMEVSNLFLENWTLII